MSHYQDAFDNCMMLYEEAFKDHVLKKISENLYYLGRTNSGMYCAYITFMDNRCIGITGDICIQGNGVFSSAGYSLEWFLRELHADYLGTKFLQREWVQECVMDFVDDGIEEAEKVELDDPSEIAAFKMRDALAFIKAHELWDEHEFYERWKDHADDHWPRRWYKPEALAMLSTVQRKFRELYREVDNE